MFRGQIINSGYGLFVADILSSRFLAYRKVTVTKKHPSIRPPLCSAYSECFFVNGLQPGVIIKVVAVINLALALLAGTLSSLMTTTPALAHQASEVAAIAYIAPPPHQIDVLACPTGPSISFTPSNPQPGESVAFEGNITSSGGGGPITFTWSFGDGSSGIGQSLPHVYSFSGVYAVMMTATGNACGSPPSVTRLITVGSGVTPAALLYLPVILKNPLILPTAFEGNLVNISLPAQVNGLRGSTTGGRTHLAWSPNPPSDGVISYYIYRKAQQGAAFQHLAVGPANTTRFIDSSSCGQIYYVTAVNKSGESGASVVSYYTLACP